MGDANTSRASKGKAILEGFYKRAKGEMPDTGEKAPRTGLGLKDRFNALRQSVAPTDPVPMKITDKTPVSEREKEATVIQTSAVRSSGGVRFSDRIGLDVSSGPEGEFERISFDDEDNATLSEQAEDPVRTAHTGKEIKGVPVIFEEDAERTHEVKSSANAVKETVPEKKMSEPAVKAAVNDTEIRTETKEKETFRAPVTEQEVRKEVKADPVITSGDGFDGGYDFLPVRGSSQRSANGNNMRTRPAPVMKDAPAAKQDVPEKKQSTILADRLKARLSPKVKR
ncbi:MAG: hypothetical protein FWG58_02145, partial [Methanomassiliicoccaceae archaeon]|nr:hypothetical protein [Methanomassiliicoccaceae archaeon]